MTICMTGTEAHLEGDWTLTEATRNLESLANSLQQMEPGSEKNLRIDCGRINEADIGGLQLLNVWIQCVKFRGIEPTLVNVPKRLQHSMQVLVGHCFVDTCPEALMLAG